MGSIPLVEADRQVRTTSEVLVAPEILTSGSCRLDGTGKRFYPADPLQRLRRRQGVEPGNFDGWTVHGVSVRKDDGSCRGGLRPAGLLVQEIKTVKFSPRTSARDVVRYSRKPSGSSFVIAICSVPVWPRNRIRASGPNSKITWRHAPRRSAGSIALGCHGDCFDPHASSFGSHGGKDGIALGANSQPVRRILTLHPEYWAPLSVRMVAPHIEIRVGGVRVLEGSAGGRRAFVLLIGCTDLQSLQSLLKLMWQCGAAHSVRRL